VFEVLDFGSDEEEEEIRGGRGKLVYLTYYAQRETYLKDTSVLQNINRPSNLQANIHIFCANALESHIPDQYCIAVERQDVTLSHVVSKIERDKRRNRSSTNTNNHYGEKITAVLRTIGRGVQQLHQQGIVHGRITLDTCGKFEEEWKVMDLIGMQFIGEGISSVRFCPCAPPEAVQWIEDQGSGDRDDVEVTLYETIPASCALDIWAFGKLMYEALVGKPLFETSSDRRLDDEDDDDDNTINSRTIHELGIWDEDNLRHIIHEVEAAGIGTIGADLISHCLCPYPEDRPGGMEEVLNHPYWKTFSTTATRSSGSRCRSSKHRSGLRQFEC